MSNSKRKITVSSLLVGLFLLLGSYQNCALHQSDGRKQLDSLLSRQSSVTSTNCLPYISQYDTDVIFDQATTTEFVSSTSVPSCKIVGVDEYFGAGIAICTLIQDPKFLVPPTDIGTSNNWTIYNNKVYYYQSSTDSYVDKLITDATPAAPTGEDQYYGVAVQNGSYISYHFIGAVSELGIECRYSVDKDQFDTAAQLRMDLAKRGSRLVHKLFDVCITNGNCSF